MAFCVHCGTKLDDGAAFCNFCGEKTGGAASPVTTGGSAPFTAGAPYTADAPGQSAGNQTDIKSLSTLTLVSIILFSISPVFYFIVYQMLQISAGYFPALWIFPSLCTIASYITGMAALAKLRKISGSGAPIAALVLLIILTLIQLFHFIRNLIYMM